jgi:hypothetical protein
LDVSIGGDDSYVTTSQILDHISFALAIEKLGIEKLEKVSGLC